MKEEIKRIKELEKEVQALQGALDDLYDDAELKSPSGSKERVAYDLMRFVCRKVEGTHWYNEEPKIIALYSRCLKVTGGLLEDPEAQ